MEPIERETISEGIERLAALDAAADPLQKGVRLAAPQEFLLKDLLSGTWLGHPLHPPLADVVIGAWTSALLLDLLGGGEGGGGGRPLGRAGPLAAVPTA